MRFSQYVKDTWDGDEFCHKLAEAAQSAIYKIYVEMAMGKQVIHDPKYPILHDADDYKFLIQFPPKIWTKALNWRYNDGLRDIMRSRDTKKYGSTHIPEGWDYTNKLVLPVGSDRYVFGSDDGPKNIYIGLTHLVKKLTSPSKGVQHDMTYHPEKAGEPHPHWAGEGPSLAEIDPHQTDPNHPQHPSNYKHGLYDFDLDNLAEISDEDIEDVPDSDIQAWLGSPLSERDLNDPEVQAEIKKIRAAMKGAKKHTMAAYDVPQLTTTSKDLSDWITANALPERIYGEHPVDYKDPHEKDKDGNPIVHAINYKSPEQANKEGMGYISRKNPKEGGYTLRHHIPTISRHLTFKVFDKSNKEKTVDQNFSMPFLNPQKTIPQLRQGITEDLSDDELRDLAMSRMPDKVEAWNWQPGEKFEDVKARLKDQPEELAAFTAATKTNRLNITDDQKRQIAMMRKPDKVTGEWNWQPGESYASVEGRLMGTTAEEQKKNKEKVAELRAAVKVDTLKNFLKFWDVWTPEQKKFLKENARNIHAMARHVFGKTPETHDILASPRLVYAAGPRPNYKSPAQGALDVPPEKMSAFIAEYIPKLKLELEAGVPLRGPGDTPLSQDELTDIATKFKSDSSDKSKGTGGKMGKFLNQMERSGDYAPQVIDALRKRIDPLTTFAAYLLLTFLNDRRYGIEDARFNLLTRPEVTEPSDDENSEEGKTTKKSVNLKANENMRAQKVQWFLKSAAQIGFDDVGSRKYRERFGVPTMQSLSDLQAAGQTVSQEQLEKMKASGGQRSMRAKRRWLNSSLSSIARAGQKLHVATAALPDFLELRRNQILAKLGNSPEAAAALQDAEQKIASTVEAAIAIYDKYDKELQSQIPDEDQRENEVMKRVKEALLQDKNLNVSDLNMEEILARTRNSAIATKTPPNAEKIVGPMDAWVQAFMNLDNHKSIALQTFDETQQKVVPTHEHVTPALIPVQPHKIMNLLYELYQYPKLVVEAIKKHGFKMYEKVYNAHEWGSLTPEEKAEMEAEMKQEWSEEEAKWEKSLLNYAVPAGDVTQMPQQQQPQQQAAKALAPQAAAPQASLDTLFAMAPKVNNSTDLLKFGQYLLSQKAQMMAAPGSAQKLEQAVATLKKNREFFAKGLPPKEEYIMFKNLDELVFELEAEHNG